MDRIEVAVHSYTNPELEGLYDELLDPDVPCVVIDDGLSHENREALEEEAECYRVKAPRDRLKFCYSPRSYENMDRERIRALRRCIEDRRPDWVERVRMATLMDNEVYTIVHLSGVPPYPAVAILENMIERGELPTRPDWR
jgi:hypothetical protein